VLLGLLEEVPVSPIWSFSLSLVSSSGLGRWPFKPVTRVRTPVRGPYGRKMKKKIGSELASEINKNDELKSVIVMLKSSMDLDSVNGMKISSLHDQHNFIEDLHARGLLKTANVRTHWLSNSVTMLATNEEIQEIAERYDVESIELDFQIKLDDPVDEKKNDNSRCWGLKAIRSLSARTSFDVAGRGVVVGILDTGLDSTHHEFSEGRILAFRDFIEGDNRKAYDDHGHGTHCAGTIGGWHDQGEEISVAPECSFVVGKMLSAKGGGSASDILHAMEWIVDPTGDPKHRPRLISNSWGANGMHSIFERAVSGWRRLGILPVFAAGNAGPEPGTVGTPGGYRNAFAIGATTEEREIAVFSSRGPVWYDGEEYIKPDVVAPGHLIRSAWPGGGYRTISGTSMATPHVAGLAALLLEKDPGLTPEQVISVIETTTHLGKGKKDNDWGWGQIDCYDALKKIS
jgi:subtilisin family serine protease